MVNFDMYKDDIKTAFIETNKQRNQGIKAIASNENYASRTLLYTVVL